MNKHFWIGLIVGFVISGIVGGFVGISMVGKKAVVPPSELETHIVDYLKTLKIPEAPPPAVPVENNEENQLEGGEHFGHHCAVCHDLEGDADSDFARAFNPPVADVTSEDIQRYSDGQLKWIVDNGIRFTGMPGWENIIDEATQWKIVYYMRALADPEQAGKLEAELKATGKWKVEAPSEHHHEEGEMHEGDEHSQAEPEEHQHDESSSETETLEQSRLGGEPALEYSAYLGEPGQDTIKVIKEVRVVTGLGLSDAKALVDAAPSLLKENVSMQEAEQIKAGFAEIGATVEIR